MPKYFFTKGKLLNGLFGFRVVVRRRRVRIRIKSKKRKAEYLKYKDQAKIFVINKVTELNKNYGYKINRITIRNQKTRWGSCSKKGNMNFNYKIVLLPDKLAEYIIVHEICHLGEFNHSANFWNLVAQTVPDYKEKREELHKAGRII
ncbi:MAG: M48 family metallopeptidase [Candidatus Taylorbacteria bacterium]|nr:M48 family metallopeptidase [Candidatus Taylorbacteria bacterium]